MGVHAQGGGHGAGVGGDAAAAADGVAGFGVDHLGDGVAEGGEEFAAEITAALKRAAGADGGAIVLDSWGTASVVYEITN